MSAVFDLKKALQMAKADPACERALKPLKGRIPDELMHRASSFSFRFWWKHLSPMSRSILGIGSAVIFGSLFLCCGGFGVLAIFFQRERKALPIKRSRRRTLSGTLATRPGPWRNIVPS